MGIFLLIVCCLALYFHIRIRKIEERFEQLSRGYRPSENGVPAQGITEKYAPTPGGTLGGDNASMERAWAAPVPPPGYRADVPASGSKVPTESKEEHGARILGRVGAIAILCGVSFFLKYAFEHNWISPAIRVALGILTGLGISGVAHYLRNKDSKYLNYSDILFGCGIGLLYLSIFASYGFYHLVGAPVAFLLMILVTIFALVISVAENSLGLAVLAIAGGFLTPVLLSTGENHLVTLSVYMFILDLGVLGIALWKKWMPLNLLTFVGTVALFFGWFIRFYHTADQLAGTFFFATLFFVTFLATSVVHHFARKELSTPKDLFLLVANAAIYFSFSTMLLDPKYHDLLGSFALVLSVLYLTLAYAAYSANSADRTLNLFLPGIAIVFLSIAIPLQFSGYVVTVAWIAEALILVATGLYLRERVIQVFGWIVLAVGLVSVGQDVEMARSCRDQFGNWKGALNGHEPDASWCNVTPFFNAGSFLMLLGATALSTIAGFYHKMGDKTNRANVILAVFVLLANIWFVGGVTSEIKFKYDRDIAATYREASERAQQDANYYGNRGGYNAYGAPYYAPSDLGTSEKVEALRNSKNTAITVFWTIYALLLLAIGFAKRIREARVFGLILFFIAAGKVFIDVWALGQIYRIASSIIFGVVALVGSFLYVRYKDRLKDIIYNQ